MVEDLNVGELDDDLEFLMRAVRKVESIREDLGKVGPVIADQVEDAMLGRRRRLDTRTAEEKAAPLRSLLKFERKLREQIDRLREQLDESRRELSLTPQHVQSVVEIALELAGQPPLQCAFCMTPTGGDAYNVDDRLQSMQTKHENYRAASKVLPSKPSTCLNSEEAGQHVQKVLSIRIPI